MISKILFGILALAASLSVQAQSGTGAPSSIPTGISVVPPCVLNCTTIAATQAGCGSVNNVTCVCSSQPFQAASLACLQSDCSSSDQAAAAVLQSTLCGVKSIASSLAPGGLPSTGSGSGISTPASSGASTAASSRASGGSSSGPTAPSNSGSLTAPPATSTASSQSTTGGSSPNNSPTTSAPSGSRKAFEFAFSHMVGLIGVMTAMLLGVGSLL
ncbi:hypothetical protein K439DRAFT_1638781 [Ramaria rubella]|nr:hypothetical protein K439DRAFT_1638781 [Ramaria rubella]